MFPADREMTSNHLCLCPVKLISEKESKMLWQTMARAILVVSILGLMVNAKAGVFTTANLAADGSNLDNSATILWAFNFVDDKTGVSNQTVNGVTFVPFEEAEHDTNADLEVWFGTNPSFERMWLDMDPATNMGITNSALAEVMDDTWETFGSVFGRDGRITLKGLTIGGEYRLQMLAGRDAGVDPNYGWEIIAGSDTQPVSIPGGTPGNLTTYEFTATAATLDVDFNATTARGYLSAASLTLIPEPGSIILVGIGAGLLLARRRK